MKHSDFTGLEPANDNPQDDRQGDLFAPPAVELEPRARREDVGGEPVEQSHGSQ